MTETIGSLVQAVKDNAEREIQETIEELNQLQKKRVAAATKLTKLFLLTLDIYEGEPVNIVISSKDSSSGTG